MNKTILSLIFGITLLGGCAAPTAPSGTVSGPSIFPEVSTYKPVDPRFLAPDHVLIDLFTGQLERAIQRAFQSPGGFRMSPQKITDLVTVGVNTRPAATYVFPNPAGNQVVIPAGNTSARFTINISLADKLAVGKTLFWKVCFSLDGGVTWPASECYGATWQSYGPGGYFDTFNNVQNPDPYREVTLTNRIGQDIQGTFILDQQLDCGLTIDVR